jgi:hypothetical protein
MLDTETGVMEQHKLMHTSGEAEDFCRKLASPAMVGIETVGNEQWFVQLLCESERLAERPICAARHELARRRRCVFTRIFENCTETQPLLPSDLKQTFV